MTLSRTTPLTSSKEHQRGMGDGDRVYCSRCGRPYRYDSETGTWTKPPYGPCPGMKQTGGPKKVSDRRTEKRKARGIRGPLQDFVRTRRCEVPGCQLQGEPAHYRTVNAGHGDWEQVGDPETGVRWVGRIGPLCPSHHRTYDGEVGGGSGEAFEKRHGIDFEQICAEWGGRFAERHGIDLTAREHPYRQMGWAD